MMTKSSLALASALLLCACDIKQDLGDTATDGSTGGDSESGSGTTPPDDTGLPTDSESTSGTSVGETGMPTASTSTTSPTEDTGITESESDSESSGTTTGGELEVCEQSEEFIRWAGGGVQELRDAIGSFGAGVAVGDCSLSIDEPSADDEATVELNLSCTMNGEANGEEFVDRPTNFRVPLVTNYATETLFSEFDDTVRARFVVTNNFNPDNGGWLVLDEPVPDGDAYSLLVLGNGAGPQPAESDYLDHFGDDWLSGGLLLEQELPTCAPEVEIGCNAEPRALLAYGGDREPVIVHSLQTVSTASNQEGSSYQVHARDMWEVEGIECLDFPGLQFEYAAILREN